MRQMIRREIKELGVLRTSQLITSFGVGAMVDFREESVILGGADDWYNPSDEDDERILHCHNLEKVLGREFFVRPKCDKKNRSRFNASVSHDIEAYRFPKTLYCPSCTHLWSENQLAGLQKGELHCPRCRSRLVPSRFVVVCCRGHIDDFPYAVWVHRGEKCPKKQDGYPDNLKLFNINGRTNLGSLMVSCEDCGKIRSMQDAFVPEALAAVYKCAGFQPWLQRSTRCTEHAVVRMRASAGVYMPVNISALNLPAWSNHINKVLLRHLDSMDGKSESALIYYVEKKIRPYLPNIPTEQILNAYRALCSHEKEDYPSSSQELYEKEYRVLCLEAKDERSDYRSRKMDIPEKYQGLIQQIISVERLTEVVAMIGFTRLYGWNGDLDSPNLAPIFSHKQDQWLPAVDMHGEGIFIQLNEQRVTEWETHNRFIYASMMQRVKEDHIHCENASARYVLLHTLAHLFIRSLSGLCGYHISSLKERIYSTYPGGERMAGILIYTASPDAEGSLGGLSAQAAAEHMQENLDTLLNDAEWCSGDPLCMISAGANAQGLHGLNYAACHQCALLPETSCVMRNLLLDRAALIGRFEDGTVGYFPRVI